ncbi:hypothetical protein [Aneurinibacillus terranovensis]|uniref:hypothetical protein n=1 Tax=Aneurinibacillus terranovensis TaxID=278991 RepID=UPI0003FDE3B3|nr:hypothetical protein [Aneurinibacillus terranovensis]
MKEYRDCFNCWWKIKGKQCNFLKELKELQYGYTNGLCWGWRPQNVKDKVTYLETYGREVDRIGVLPALK